MRLQRPRRARPLWPPLPQSRPSPQRQKWCQRPWPRPLQQRPHQGLGLQRQQGGHGQQPQEVLGPRPQAALDPEPQGQAPLDLAALLPVSLAVPEDPVVQDLGAHLDQEGHPEAPRVVHPVQGGLQVLWVHGCGDQDPRVLPEPLVVHQDQEGQLPQGLQGPQVAQPAPGVPGRRARLILINPLQWMQQQQRVSPTIALKEIKSPCKTRTNIFILLLPSYRNCTLLS